jgi:peptide/nickel transport system substrate-binding protein
MNCPTRHISYVQRRQLILPCILIFLMVLLAGLVAACGQVGMQSDEPTPVVAPSPTPATEITLEIVYWQSPGTLNPHLSGALRDQHAGRLVFEPLVTFDADDQAIPILAASVPSVENGDLDADGRFVIWRLLPDVVWADGVPFTADDVRFTFDYITNETAERHPSSAAIYNNVASVEVMNSHTIKITFVQPNPDAWQIPFAGPHGVILPQHVYSQPDGSIVDQAYRPTAELNRLAFGTGPFQVITFEPQETLFLGNEIIQTVRIVFEANPHFRETGKPYIDRIILHGGSTIDEAARQVLERGEAHYAWNLLMEAERLAKFEATGHGYVVPNFGTRVERLLLNRSDWRIPLNGERSHKDEPNPFFSDLLVRQAISLAVDRQAIAALYGPNGRPTGNILVAPERYISLHTSYEYNPEQARQLLAEAGWVDSNGDGIREKNGRSFQIVSQTANEPLRVAGQQIIQQNLRDVGIEMEIKLIDPSNFGNSGAVEHLWHFYADMQQLFTGGNSPDPAGYMQRWRTAAIPQRSNNWTGWNVERWQNEEYDRLFAQMQGETDTEVRQQQLIALNDMLINDVVTIPLVHIAQPAGISNNLSGISLTPWDSDHWNIKDWRLSP